MNSDENGIDFMIIEMVNELKGNQRLKNIKPYRLAQIEKKS